MGSLEEMVNSRLYQSAVESICEDTNIIINSEYGCILQHYDNERLKKAKVEIVRIYNLLETDYQKIADFSKAKIFKYYGVNERQEFPSGEGSDRNDIDDNVFDHGLSKGFLVMYMIEYFIIKNSPDFLIDYLKPSRVPYAKKYEREIKEIYKKLCP